MRTVDFERFWTIRDLIHFGPELWLKRSKKQKKRHDIEKLNEEQPKRNKARRERGAFVIASDDDDYCKSMAEAMKHLIFPPRHVKHRTSFLTARNAQGNLRPFFLHTLRNVITACTYAYSQNEKPMKIPEAKAALDKATRSIICMCLSTSLCQTVEGVNAQI